MATAIATRAVERITDDRPFRADLSTARGAVVIGSDYRGLTVARSLGRKRIPVCVLTEQQSIATKSRYVQQHFTWPREEAAQLEFLVQLATQNRLCGWLLIPTDDGHAALLARHHDRLDHYFTLATSPWRSLKWAYNKALTYRLARFLKIPCPRTECPRNQEELARLDFSFPAILKPAFKKDDNPFTHSKAWMVSNREELEGRFDEACSLVGHEAVMIQELIPGGGEYQFSFGALCREGRPLVSVTARRVRQFPPIFGRSSSYVQTIENTKLETYARRLLGALQFTGLAELEFKQDPRNGQYKILDFNPRVWGWHTIGLQAGIDFPYLFWRLAQDEPIAEVHAQGGLSWIRMVNDIPAVLAELWKGRLSLMSYLASRRKRSERAVFAPDDLLPTLLELPLLMVASLRRRFSLESRKFAASTNKLPSSARGQASSIT